MKVNYSTEDRYNLGHSVEVYEQYQSTNINIDKRRPNKQCRVDEMLGVGNHISHYLPPILNTF